MESSLHRTLKDHYGSGSGGRSEVVLEGYRIDAVDARGALIEIQSGALGPLRSKLRGLLPRFTVRVVKPVVLARRVVRKKRLDGPDTSSRRSPKLGALTDVFEDLVGLAGLLPEQNLQVELLAVAIDEIRVPRRRWPGYAIADRRLLEILGTCLIETPPDLWKLLPEGHDWKVPFTTADIALRMGRPLWFAQRVAYCLRVSGAAREIGKHKHHRLYTEEGAPASF
jgi:hypothetical protein